MQDDTPVIGQCSTFPQHVIAFSSHQLVDSTEWHRSMESYSILLENIGNTFIDFCISLVKFGSVLNV